MTDQTVTMTASPTEDPSRITRVEVPSNDPDIKIVAGWNGNVGSYFFSAMWITDRPGGVRAGDIDLEVGYPLDMIDDVADLAARMMQQVDLSSPYVVAAFYQLMGDKIVDIAIQRYKGNPYGQEHLPALITKVLDKDFTPITEPVEATPLIGPSHDRVVFSTEPYTGEN